MLCDDVVSTLMHYRCGKLDTQLVKVTEESSAKSKSIEVYQARIEQLQKELEQNQIRYNQSLLAKSVSMFSPGKSTFILLKFYMHEHLYIRIKV